MKRLLLILPLALLAVAMATPAPKPCKPIKTKINPKDGAKMVYIPAGEFLMGSDDSDDNQKPPHRVRLTRSYWLYQTEVTNARYGKFVAATGYRKPKYVDDDRFNAPQQPVVGVSWEDAVAYCHWAGVRLPTEAEWEYAAAGSDGRRYPWGNKHPEKTQVVYYLYALKRAAPVGQRPKGASPFGALDMAGNVYEWCADWYGEEYYRQSPAADPRGPAEGRERVLRGGSWHDGASHLLVAHRYGYAPAFGYSNGGFRPGADG